MSQYYEGVLKRVTRYYYDLIFVRRDQDGRDRARERRRVRGRGRPVPALPRRGARAAAGAPAVLPKGAADGPARALLCVRDAARGDPRDVQRGDPLRVRVPHRLGLVMSGKTM